MVEDSYDLTKKKDERTGYYNPKSVPVLDVMEEVGSKFNDVEVVERKGNRAEVRVESKFIKEVLTIFRNRGYDHFVALTCIDLFKENLFELVYHLWSYGAKVHVYVKTTIDREEAEMDSIVDVFRSVITYEREILEMFGVNFPGNPRLTDFILEDWQGPPPMRKDFDSIQYVQDTFDMEVRHPKGLPPKNVKGGDE